MLCSLSSLVKLQFFFFLSKPQAPKGFELTSQVKSVDCCELKFVTGKVYQFKWKTSRNILAKAFRANQTCVSLFLLILLEVIGSTQPEI